MSRLAALAAFAGFKMNGVVFGDYAVDEDLGALVLTSQLDLVGLNAGDYWIGLGARNFSVAPNSS